MRIVMVGASGYGAQYLGLMDRELGCFCELCAVVDPFAEKSPYFQRFVDEGIPVYNTLEDFFAQGAADLVIISSPIQFHERQSITALSGGAHVLCEKPLTAKLEQALHIRDMQRKTGKQFGVGFQWSYSDVMQRMKQGILAGEYGRPLNLKAHVSWPRADAYYFESSWKGRLRDDRGEWVMDSIVTNATAHYLHNIFFLLGDQMDTARMPKSVEASLYRARPIETFDTCFMRGEFADGCRFFYGVTHVGDGEVTPRFHYCFEKADIIMPHDMAEVTVYWKDGREESLGTVQSHAAAAQKLRRMRESAQNDTPALCGIDTALPHLAVSNALFEKVPVDGFPPELLVRQENPTSVAVHGLCEASCRCYEQDAMPDALGYAWAAAPTRINFNEKREWI